LCRFKFICYFFLPVFKYTAQKEAPNQTELKPFTRDKFALCLSFIYAISQRENSANISFLLAPFANFIFERPAVKLRQQFEHTQYPKRPKQLI